MANKHKRFERLGEERQNNQGCLMKIVEYDNALDIVVEFQDEYKTRIKTRYSDFVKGDVKNPYYPIVYNVGILGVKYPATINGVATKEYNAWHGIIERCFSNKLKEKYPTYKNITCCNEWLNYENFYEWLHSQENFNKWLVNQKWNIDKDILVKNNKIYSPNTCCLVPQNVNVLFTKRNGNRGNLPIGVSLNNNKSYYIVQFSNPLTNDKNSNYVNKYSTIEEAFLSYKELKENVIKQIAKIEYDKGNITKECYIAMMKYEVEITD